LVITSQFNICKLIQWHNGSNVVIWLLSQYNDCKLIQWRNGPNVAIWLWLQYNFVNWYNDPMVPMLWFDYYDNIIFCKFGKF